MSHHVVWVDIPVFNLERAMEFYKNVLGFEVNKMDQMPAAVFAHQENEVSGCLVHDSENSPSEGGILIYLNVEGRLDEVLEKVEEYEGEIKKEKHSIGPYGFRAIICDCEGNRVALHSKT